MVNCRMRDSAGLRLVQLFFRKLRELSACLHLCPKGSAGMGIIMVASSRQFALCALFHFLLVLQEGENTGSCFEGLDGML